MGERGNGVSVPGRDLGLVPAGWGGRVAALTLGSLLVGAGKRGRRNSVGSLDSTIEVSVSSCPTHFLHEPCPGRGAPKEEGTCCLPLFRAGNHMAASPSQPLSPSVLTLSVLTLPVSQSVFHSPMSLLNPRGQLQIGMPLDLGLEKL